jgi:hypothetical protein|tara:strand:- start:3617 stop:4492 length:876 start_codon:yes stop_codon:yes gene_type:complete
MWANLAVAQTEITIQTDTDYVFIGDIINVDLAIESNEQLIWPDISALIAPLEIQSLGKIDTLKTGNISLYHQRLSIQSFDTVSFVLPSLAFISLAEDTFYSDSIAMAFLEVPLDTTNAIFDIKEPREVPFNFAEAQPYIWSGLAFLLLLGFILFLFKKLSNKTSKKRKEIILIPCEIEASEALKQLESKDYITNGLVKSHYVELTEILRHYFDREFEIDTLESTTEETIELLKEKELDRILIEQISTLLVEADLVKFAKSSPDSRTSNNYMTKSFEIVENCHKMKTEVKDV